MEKNDKKLSVTEGVKAADTTLHILEKVAFAQEPLGVTQIASDIGIAKSAVFKHLHTLSERGYLTQDPISTRYKLGPKAWLISKLAPSTDDITALTEPLMREARTNTGLAVVLSTPTPKSAFVLATFPGNKSIEIGVRPGSELELHASAQGKIFLAYGPKSMTDSLAKRKLQALTSCTITSFEELLDQIGEVRKRGYASAPEESLLGVNAIAAPIYDYRDNLVASVGLVGSIQHLPKEDNPQTVKTILDLAASISKVLGNGMMS
ncbi:IclR family transcriptional regulator [Mesorhizobium sp. CGMCC 1.15528]|uniref:IclR family transcriptional regulator n=1 Tax=Mesorhizobium zhangyense TaxID=1776730 RepID=A0A7C9V6X7_9HYPH|nr:IclR family transcriptional regulator [Mesorhizobium zhangyense]NGN41864.1 IclR family transcriptional regulator [Mesorhizobium zhangyense]